MWIDFGRGRFNEYKRVDKVGEWLNMRILVIIPAYNEAANIKRVVDNLIRNYPQYDYVVVNDGSKDNTADICRDNNYNLLNLPVNLGLAGAFQTGIKYAYSKNYNAAVQLDGDGQHDPKYIKRMIESRQPMPTLSLVRAL
jgi:glycosyltransferase involved in cell wall biosynthesis